MGGECVGRRDGLVTGLGRIGGVGEDGEGVDEMGQKE
jgi:hypothetical protein